MDGIHQIIDDQHAVYVGDIGGVGVSGCRVGVGMAEDYLNLSEAEALLEEMCRKTVSQGMYGDFFLMPHSATTVFMACCTPPLSI